MSTWKLVSGILSCVFFLIVTMQSCAVGFANIVTESGESSGTAGFLLALFMLAGGITSIVMRNNQGKGNLALGVVYLIGLLIGLTLRGNYSDLLIWGLWCGVNALVAASIYWNWKQENKEKTDTPAFRPKDAPKQPKPYSPKAYKAMSIFLIVYGFLIAMVALGEQDVNDGNAAMACAWCSVVGGILSLVAIRKWKASFARASAAFYALAVVFSLGAASIAPGFVVIAVIFVVAAVMAVKFARNA